MQVDKVVIDTLEREITTAYADGKAVVKFGGNLAKVSFSYCISEHWFNSETELVVEDYLTLNDVEEKIKNIMNGLGEWI